MNLISLNSIIESTKHNKNTILKVANILNIKSITLPNKLKYKYYSVEDKDRIVSFINEHSPIETYFRKLNIHCEFGEYRTLTDFKKLVKWDRSKILICMNHLNINYIDIKGQTKIYSNEDYIKYKTFVENKIREFSLLKDVYTKAYLCKELKINYEKFDTLCKYNNIKPIFDWGFGKDSKYYSKEDFNLLSNILNESKLESEKRYNIHELCDIFQKEDSTICKAIKLLNIPYFISVTREYLIDDNGFIKLQDYFSTTEMQGISYKEKELVGFIKSLGIDFIENDRSIISPKELDIYIPSKKLAIEFDGLYYHSELFIDKNYHLDKTNLCNEKGIDLIHVFEDDWKYRKEIVKSMIKSRLGIYERKIFARKCTVKKISNSMAKLFFDENHLQGYAKTSDVHIGLFYNDELVQAISITNKGWHDGNVELTRMVSKKNMQVVGGFSKLIKYYCKNYNCNNLISYVFKAWFNGKGYINSGFKIIKENKPNYFYIMNNVKLHKSNFRKDKLKRMYENGKIKIYSDEMTESEICKSNNIYKIYDCGTVKVKYEFLT